MLLSGVFGLLTSVLGGLGNLLGGFLSNRRLKLGALPVATWRYRWEAAGVRHLGPMAQDWHATFRLGQGDTTIPMVDAHGVLVVAVQALHRQLGELRAEVEQLHQKLADHSPHH